MVALPLALGIAQASGVPPMAGILSAVIGGLVTTFFRGSHLAINGPAAGLITVVLGAIELLRDPETGVALPYVFAAIVVAGVIQVLLGLLKLGKLGDLFPSSVIHGVLAAIGVIILVTQLDDAFGFTYSTEAKSILQKIVDLPTSVGGMNPLVAIIGVLGIAFLLIYPKITYNLVRFVPAAMWVLIIGVLIVFATGLYQGDFVELLGMRFEAGSKYLIELPEDLSETIMFPDFGRIGDPRFWMAVFSIVLIASIESLASSKAVDKLDPYKRNTDLNRDLVGVGLGTIVCGLLGGLPIITVIVRSSVNVQNNARTKWSNLYHGIILVVIILLLAPIIQKVPLAALGGLLVYTGYKLAGPTVFKHTAQHGWEQVLFMVTTIVATIASNLLYGIIAGILITLLSQIIASRLPIGEFFKFVFKPAIRIVSSENQQYRVTIRRVANFLTILRIKNVMDHLPSDGHILVDLSQARLVDLTVMEYLQSFGRSYQQQGGTFRILGHQQHDTTSEHPLALRTRPTVSLKLLTRRQTQLKQLAQANNWDYQSNIEWENEDLKAFHFFETRPVEYKENRITGTYEQYGCGWEIADITFDEGALVATEVYHSTVEILHLPVSIPRFSLEREGKLDKIFDRVMRFAGYKDIDFKLFPSFSDKFLLEGPDEAEIYAFFTPSLIRFFENNEIYHIESNGNALFIFRRLRLSKSEEIKEMLLFCENLVGKLISVQKPDAV